MVWSPCHQKRERIWLTVFHVPSIRPTTLRRTSLKRTKFFFMMCRKRRCWNDAWREQRQVGGQMTMRWPFKRESILTSRKRCQWLITINNLAKCTILMLLAPSIRSMLRPRKQSFLNACSSRVRLAVERHQFAKKLRREPTRVIWTSAPTLKKMRSRSRMTK